MKRPGIRRALLLILALAGCRALPPADPADLTRLREALARPSALAPAGSADPIAASSLRRLAELQAPDGSWPAPDPLRATAASMIALRDDPGSQDALRRGASWLLARQRPDGLWTPSGDSRCALHQFLATWSLAEAQEILSDPFLLQGLERAVAAIAAHQRPDGAWAPTFGLVSPPSAFATAGQSLALRAAARGGASSPALFQAAARSLPALARGGQGNRADRALCAVGLQVLGHGLDDPALEGLEALTDTAEMWPHRAEAPLLQAFLIHLASSQHKGWMDRRWLLSIRGRILARRGEDGFWQPPAGEREGGPVYATALCALMLNPVRSRAPDQLMPIPPAWRVRGRNGTATVIAVVPLRSSDALRLPDSMTNELERAPVVRSTMDERSLWSAAEQRPASDTGRLHAWFTTLTSLNRALQRERLDAHAILRTFVSCAPQRPTAEPLLTEEDSASVLRLVLALDDKATLAAQAGSADLRNWRALRAAWCIGDPVRLAAICDAWIGAPEALAPLRRRTIQSLVDSLDPPGHQVILLDAWLLPSGAPENDWRSAGLVADRLAQ